MDDDEVTVIQPVEKDADADSKPVCMVCYNAFHSKTRVPKILPCGHSFCQECIVGLIRSRPDSSAVVCATCRRSYRVDPENVSKSVPTNFVLRDMLEKYETVESGPQSYFRLCSDCRKEDHEKNMMFCKTCTPGDISGDSLDFMGRPKVHLSCAKCIETKHKGHSYDPPATVAARWKHRFIYDKFEKTVKEESARVQKLMSALTNALKGITRYNYDLQETVRQLKWNVSVQGVSSVVRNFVKAANDSSRFLDMTTECVSRINNTNSPHYNLVGKRLFIYPKIQRNSEPMPNYRSDLSKLFATINEPSLSNSIPNDLSDEAHRVLNSSKPAKISPRDAASPQQAQDNQPGPVPPVHDIQNPQPVQGVILRDLQQVENPPVQPINHDQLNVMLDYYFNIGGQQRANYAGMMLDAVPGGYDLIGQARLQAFNVAAQYAQQHQAPILRQNDPVPLRAFYQLPFHLFNAYLPQLYNHTVEGVIALFVNLVQLEAGGDEVREFFFVPPYENSQFTRAGIVQIRRVLDNMMSFLIPGEILHTQFERLKLAIDQLNQGEMENANVNVPVVNPGDIDVNPDLNGRQENIVVPQQNQYRAQEQVDDGGVVPLPDVVEPIPIDANEHNDNVGVVVLQFGAQEDVVPIQEHVVQNAPEPDGQVVVQVHQEPMNRQRDPDDDEEIEMLQRAPRANYTFLVDCLDTGPPARET
ncbi:hypothetical protein CAEBREN_02162 [Caenorhabditis brenneri]|uniref:RING-type domain-containing protein n=1 Tax=Caenorhabditis brenneri TaxID=135651 RepID=G0PMT6_CAEBE|nr:hypothetical protein CAEBREN_02162 [Caenorhabditis brenneri]